MAFIRDSVSLAPEGDDYQIYYTITTTKPFDYDVDFTYKIRSDPETGTRTGNITLKKNHTSVVAKSSYYPLYDTKYEYALNVTGIREDFGGSSGNTVFYVSGCKDSSCPERKVSFSPIFPPVNPKPSEESTPSNPNKSTEPDVHSVRVTGDGGNSKRLIIVGAIVLIIFLVLLAIYFTM